MGGFERSVIASLGWDKLRFLAPLEPGDEVQLRLELLDKRVSSKPAGVSRPSADRWSRRTGRWW